MIKSLGEKHPDTKKASFIAPDSAILGDVTLAEGTSVWYGAVIRGDLDHITIGKNSIVGAGAVVSGGAHFPDGSLIVGIPAKAISDLHPVQIEHNRENAETYCKLALEHAKEAD